MEDSESPVCWICLQPDGRLKDNGIECKCSSNRHFHFECLSRLVLSHPNQLKTQVDNENVRQVIYQHVPCRGNISLVSIDDWEFRRKVIYSLFLHMANVTDFLAMVGWWKIGSYVHPIVPFILLICLIIPIEYDQLIEMELPPKWLLAIGVVLFPKSIVFCCLFGFLWIRMMVESKILIQQLIRHRQSEN